MLVEPKELNDVVLERLVNNCLSVIKSYTPSKLTQLGALIVLKQIIEKKAEEIKGELTNHE